MAKQATRRRGRADQPAVEQAVAASSGKHTSPARIPADLYKEMQVTAAAMGLKIPGLMGIIWEFYKQEHPEVGDLLATSALVRETDGAQRRQPTEE